MNRLRVRGLSVAEVLVSLSLIIIVAGLSIKAIQPGTTTAGPKALAMAVSDEFRGARQLAIQSGHPVALGLSRDSGTVSTSLYRLEGWNVPYVSWSKNYGGDYPQLGFASASWAAAGFSSTTPPPLASKFGLFDVDQWIPSDKAADSIFCFTPDGGVTSNDRPALNGRYTIVVGKALQVSGDAVSAGESPYVVYLDSAGGVNVGKGTPGASLPAGPASATSAPRPRDNLTGSARVNLSEIVVRPNPVQAGADGFCVPGQHVTLEIYAYDTDGRQLFAKWLQVPPTGGELGTFTFPDSQSTIPNLNGELERMEFLDTPPPGLDWRGAPVPTTGCFRGRWSWTVPITSTPGSVYTLQADVRDAEGEVDIQNGAAPTYTSQIAPDGKLVVERLNPNTNLWELVRMNPDGSGEKVLTPAGMEESLPSVDQGGNKIAFIQRNGANSAIKVRALDGGQEWTIAAPGDALGTYTSVSISPDGRWVSYRDDYGPTGTGSALVQGKLHVKSVDLAVQFERDQAWQYGFGANARPVKLSRTGWSPDGQWMVWENEGSLFATDLTADLNDTSLDVEILPGPIMNGTYEEQLYAPTVFHPAGAPNPIVLFSIGNVDSVLALIEFDPANPLTSAPSFAGITKPDIDGGGGSAGSANQRDDYPSVSSISELVLPREDMGSGQRRAIFIPWNGSAGTFGNFVGSANNREIIQDIRSAIWIP